MLDCYEYEYEYRGSGDKAVYLKVDTRITPEIPR